MTSDFQDLNAGIPNPETGNRKPTLAPVSLKSGSNSRIGRMQLPAIDKIASFDVDSQRTFTPLCPDELPAEGGDEIGPELNRQAGLARWRLGSKASHSPKAVWVTDDPDEVGKPCL